MNLFNSILTSLVIVAIFWGAALFQTNIAHAFEPEKTSPTLTKEVKTKEMVKKQKSTTIAQISKANIQKAETIHIAGIHQRIELADIHFLWQKFSDRPELHKHLKHRPKKVYVLYQNINKNYQQAEVTIGYDINELSKFTKHYSIDTSQYTVLLPASKYDKKQLSEAWGKMNHHKAKEYVLEVHTLNKAGDVITSQVFVSYK